jgi:hypothetical protein
MNPNIRDSDLYEKVKTEIQKRIPISSAYRSGIIVKTYKKRFAHKHGLKKSPYTGKKKNTGLKRWFREKWVNQHGEIGYHSKSDIYRPSRRITSKTPTTYHELSKNQIIKARRTKYRKGRVFLFDR